MTKRVALTGPSGFVGGSILVQAPEDISLHALSRGAQVIEKPQLQWHTLDTLDETALTETLHSIRPDAILHVAAIAAIDPCETDHTTADLVNTTFTAHLADYAGNNNCRLVYVSTDNVFDGEKGRYVENDPVNPVNYYGQTKLAAEAAVRKLSDNWVIARSALVMGLPMVGTGNAFLSKMLPALEEGEPLGVPEEEVRSPIDVVTLGAALLELATNDFQGTLHLSNNDIMNRLEMVQRIAKHAGFTNANIHANDPTKIPDRAPRPRDVSFLNTLARETLQTKFLGLEESFDHIMAWRDKT